MVASFHQYPLRWILVVLAVLVLAVVVTAVILVHALLQPERFTTLLQDNLANAGLTLTLDAPAEPTLFPHPAVRLQGFQLSLTGSNAPLLRARDARIVVPWRTLLHGGVAINQVEIDAPRIDLGELHTFLARLPHSEGPPQLPRIGAGMRMTNGTIVRNGAPLLFDLDLETGPLVPGAQFGLGASARTAADHRITLTLSMVPGEQHNGGVDFEKIALLLGRRHGAALRLDGKATWRGGANFAARLHGTLKHPALTRTPPASSDSTRTAPAAAASSAAPPAADVTDAVTIDVVPARAGTPLTVAVKLDGADAHVDARLQPGAFASWWNRFIAATPDSGKAPLPFTGNAKVQALDLGWFKAKDLRIEAGHDLAPAATAAPPASAASAGR